MLLFLVLSAVIIGTCQSTSEAAESYRIMRFVENGWKNEDIMPILYVTHPNLTYSMCGYTGNIDTFPAYLLNQFKTLNSVNFLTDFDSAEINEQDGIQYLKFHVQSDAIYNDKREVKGGADVVAVKTDGDDFRMVTINQQCRFVTTPYHRLYQLFTKENLYDYKK